MSARLLAIGDGWHNTAMISVPIWQTGLTADIPDLYADWLLYSGSLTERLIATGQTFAVAHPHLTQDFALPDEAAALGLAARHPVWCREVALTLNGVPVIHARSVTAADQAYWPPILDRGGRSLGLTLFGEPRIQRGELECCTLQSPQPLYLAAHDRVSTPMPPSLWARRCTFWQQQQGLLVQEVFLPTLWELSL